MKSVSFRVILVLVAEKIFHVAKINHIFIHFFHPLPNLMNLER